MKLRYALPAVVAAGLLVGAGVAVAQEPKADAVLTVTPSVACGRVTLDAAVNAKANPATGAFPTYEIGVYAGANDGSVPSDQVGQFAVSGKEPVSRTITLDEDAYNGDAFVRWVTISGPESQNYVSGTVLVKTDCAPPATDEPDPTPTQGPDPTPTQEPDPTPTQEPEPTDEPEPAPTSTPAPEPTSTPAPTGSVQVDVHLDNPAVPFEQVGVVPSGGVETGGGPA